MLALKQLRFIYTVTAEAIYKLTIYYICFNNNSLFSQIIIALLAKQQTLLSLLQWILIQSVQCTARDFNNLCLLIVLLYKNSYFFMIQSTGKLTATIVITIMDVMKVIHQQCKINVIRCLEQVFHSSLHL
jgi:hypothetical protein